jgi:hypothetical protein
MLMRVNECNERCTEREKRERTSSVSVLLLPGMIRHRRSFTRLLHCRGIVDMSPRLPSTRENSTNVSRHDLLPRRPLASLHRNKSKKNEQNFLVLFLFF